MVLREDTGGIGGDRPARESLPRLLRDVHRARVGLRATRGVGRLEVSHQARQRFVVSLTLYTEALDSLRLPVPYALRDELRIYRQALRAHG